MDIAKKMFLTSVSCLLSIMAYLFCETIYNLLANWEIKKKLYCMTLDNAPVKDSFIDMLKIELNLKNALYSNSIFFLYPMLCSYSLFHCMRGIKGNK